MVPTTLNTERKRKSIEYEINQLERALEELKDGTHLKYKQGLEEFECVKRQRLENAETQYRLLEQSTLVVYHYECDEAESEYNRNHEKWKSDLLEDVETDIRRYKQLVEGNTLKSKQKMKKSTRQTRSRGKVDTFGSMSQHNNQTTRPTSAQGGRVRKKNGAMFPSVRVNLLRSEVDKDIQKLEKHIRQHHHFTSSSIIRICRNRLFYNDLIIEEGDEIQVENSTSSYTGIVTAFTCSEIFVLCANGSVTSIDIMDLRQGQVIVTIITNSSDDEEDEEESDIY